MPKPSVKTYIYVPSFGAWREITSCVDLSSSYEITDAIESPSETNSFVAPDVQIKVHAGDPDKSEFQLSWLDDMLPESTDYYVRIDANGRTVFTGFLLPNTVQIDDAERWVSFTAVGMGAKLARWSAENSSLIRLVDPWYIKSASGNQWRATLVIERSLPHYSCEYLTDDLLAIDTGGGNTAQVKVISVNPGGQDAPYPAFVLIVEGMGQPFAYGSAIALATPFVRNISIQSAVNALFIAAGLAAPHGSNYGVAAISGAATQFASRPNMAGVIGVPLALAASVDLSAFEYPVLGTSQGTFVQQDPPLGSWIRDYAYWQGGASYPADWTENPAFSGMDYLLYGPRFEGYPQNSSDPESPQVYVFWRYWQKTQADAPPFFRFGLLLTITTGNATGGGFNFTVDLARDESYDGYTWARTHDQPITAGATETNLHAEVYLTCDIQVTGIRNSSSKVVFTYPVGGDPLAYAVGVAAVEDLSGYVEVVAGYRGRFQSNVLFQSDELRGNTPVARPFLCNEFGTPVIWLDPVPLPRGFDAHTFTYNRGDFKWYALSVTEEEGVLLLSYDNGDLTPRAGWVPPQIEPPGTSIYSTLDLVTVRAGVTSGPWPMMAIVGTNVWWIAYSFAGMLPYADFGGLSCGEGLAQLATIVDGTFFVNPMYESHFLSRTITNGKTIATGTAFSSTRIDDAGCITIRRSSVFYKSYRYAAVTNERDDAIFGESGDKNFKGTEQGLELSNRFVTTVSMARALAEHVLSYLGRKLQAVEVVHEADGRNYSLGRTFTAVVAGVFRTYQIIESTPRPMEGNIRLLGLEL